MPKLQGAQMFTRRARDLFTIAILIGGFDREKVVLRCFLRGTGERVTTPTLLAVLGELMEESDAG